MPNITNRSTGRNIYIAGQQPNAAQNAARQVSPTQKGATSATPASASQAVVLYAQDNMNESLAALNAAVIAAAAAAAAAVVTADAAEPGLGNPAANGDVLASTTAGVRSWVPNASPQVNSDWTAGSGVAQILNKPSIPGEASQLGNDSSVTGTTVKDALNTLSNLIAADVHYLGIWNANTNSPALASGAGSTGGYYKVSVAGSTTLDGNTNWHTGDWAIYNGTTWDKIDNFEAVTTVFSRVGAITATANDYAASLITNDTAIAGSGSYVKDCLVWLNTKIGNLVTGVSSVAGRGGAVTLTSSDVGLSNVTNNAQLTTGQLTTSVTSSSTDAQVPSALSVWTALKTAITGLLSSIGITTPTSITGLLKGASGTVAAAVAGTDYLAPNGNGSALTGLTSAQVGLGNVTNAAQLTTSQLVTSVTSGSTDAQVPSAKSVWTAITTAVTGIITSITGSTPTSLSGLLKGNGTNVLAATAGVDYQLPVPSTANNRSIVFNFSNGGSALITGYAQAAAVLDFAGTLTGVEIVNTDLAPITGGMTVDVLRHNAGAVVSTDSIVGSGTKPSVSSGTYGYQATSGLSWTSTAVAVHDVLSLNIIAASSWKNAAVILHFQVS